MAINFDAVGVISFEDAKTLKPLLRKIIGSSGVAKGDASFVILNKLERVNAGYKTGTPVTLRDLMPCKSEIFAFQSYIESLGEESPEYKEWHETTEEGLGVIIEAVAEAGGPLAPEDLPYIEGNTFVLGTKQDIDGDTILLGDLQVVDHAIIL